MDTIIIGFSRAIGFKPLSKLICLFERTNYSHVYIKFSNKHFGDYDIYQASKGFVNHITQEVFLEQNIIIKEYEIPCNNKLEIIGFVRRKLGKPYSLRSLFGIFFARFGIKISKLFDGEKAYICSELGARVLQQCKINNLEVDVDKITPRQLYEILEKITN